VKHLFADAAYDRLQLMDKATYLRFVIEIIRRRDGPCRYGRRPHPQKRSSLIFQTSSRRQLEIM
jgi:hypothetical protein